MNELLWFVVNEESRVDVYDLPFRPSGVTSKAAMCGHLKTGYRGAAGTSGFYAFIKSLSILISYSNGCEFRSSPPAAWAKLQDVAMMQRPIKHGRHRGRVTQQLAPVFYRPIGSD